MTARLSIENYIDQCAALSVTPEAASTLPLANVQLTARDRIYRSTGGHDVTIIGHWGGAGRRPTCFGMFRHRGHGGKVRLQMVSDIGFTTQVYDSGTVDIFADQPIASEIDWGGAYPFLPEDDRLAYLAPYLLLFPDPAAPASSSRSPTARTATGRSAGCGSARTSSSPTTRPARRWRRRRPARP